ncbi:CLUMA_CG010715, isoform A [Clunio marinus]|uniref:CLUMA_CG010715, isoform A n=1 Tax=Clunio marinus TaxID=568069 RepID=A0A1J1IFU3_9DIPT|nr:CLUMA_CG010715, isoform A [Clunio marinus]
MSRLLLALNSDRLRNAKMKKKNLKDQSRRICFVTQLIIINLNWLTQVVFCLAGNNYSISFRMSAPKKTTQQNIYIFLPSLKSQKSLFTAMAVCKRERRRKEDFNEVGPEDKPEMLRESIY